MKNWNNHKNRELNFKAPSTSTNGLEVTEDRAERDGMQRVHIFTEDGHEVYFEVLSFLDRIEHQSELSAQKESIEKRFEDVEATEITSTEFMSFPATTFCFESATISRTFIMKSKPLPLAVE